MANNIMSGWREVKLGDLGKIITGKTPSTKVDTYWGKNIPFVTPKDIQGSKHIFETERCLTDEGMLSVKGSILPQNTVCVSCIGNIGYVSMTTKKSVSNQQINSIIANDENDANFIYYLIKSLWPYFKNYEGQSTTVSILNKSQFSKISVNIPPVEVQRKIAGVLSALDDKIELNNKINNNLEQQAQALFLETIHKNQIGSKELISISTIKYGKGLPTNKLTKTGYKVFGGNGIIGYYTDYLYKEPQILISCRGAASGTILESHPYSYITNNSLVIELTDRRYYEFLKQYFLLNQLHSYATGSAQPQITIDNLKTVEVPYPDYNLLEKIDSSLSSIAKKKYQNICENEKLAKLRDALLPKLMSGEIDVSQVDISDLTSTDKLSFRK